MRRPKRFIWIALITITTALAACQKQPAPPAAETKTDRPQRAAAGPTCAAHGAPKELCFICDASLRDKGRLWCAEHGRYEDRCLLCHPEVEDKNRPYCQEHFLYKDECFLCRPELKGAGKPTVQAAPRRVAPMCKEHRVSEAECGICHPELVDGLAVGQGVKIRLASSKSAAMVGVTTAAPQSGVVAPGIECLAEVEFNQNRLAQIAAPVGGIIQAVELDLGAQVQSSQTVARLWSAAIAETVSKAVLAHQTLQRERRLRAQRVTSEQALQEAEAAERAAGQQARTLGLTEQDIESLAQKPTEPIYLEVRAPFAGEIIERSAVQGALVEPGKALFTVADRSVMWAMLNLPETALAAVRVGQRVQVKVDSLPNKTFEGELTWIGARVDERTRMARARAEIPNPDGALKDRMFARARILTHATSQGLLAPASAVQFVGQKPLVFVRLEDDLFEARVVELGQKRNGTVEVVAGLRPGEQIVSARGFALKSQLLISRLGAGCVDD